MKTASFLTVSLFAAVLAFPVSNAKAEGDLTLTIKDHMFTPDRLEIPAGQAVKITVVNQDATPEEFESHDLKREKVIQGNASAIINLGPLEPGEYAFFGEFHEDTAKGVIVVKAAEPAAE